MDKITATLQKLFQQHRVIFWYDEKGQLQEHYRALQLSGVEKVAIDNNEFGVKYRVMVGEPQQQFLIYSPQAKPPDEENWLLDLNLAFYEFSADEASLAVEELKLPPERKRFVQKHLPFFRNKSRVEKLKALLEPEDREERIALKMIAVLCNAPAEMEHILYELFAELEEGGGEKYESLEKFELSGIFWRFVEDRYHYRNDPPTLKDFLIRLLQNRFESSLRESRWPLNREASIFINHWMDSAGHRKRFESLSNRIAEEMDVRKLLEEYAAPDLLNSDVYRLIEFKIIRDLKDRAVEEAIGYEEAQKIIERRANKYWYKNFENIYLALLAALELKQLNKSVQLEINSLSEGVLNYAQTYFRFDAAYRRYIYHAKHSEHVDFLKQLTEQVENIYSNSYLLKLNHLWQSHIDRCRKWQISGHTMQRFFFDRYVKPFLKSDKKVFVIISDGLRYEAAVELHELLLKEDMYQSEIGFMVASLPSYTQMGMASLLPHQKLTYEEPSGNVYVDGLNSSGIANRHKILQAHSPTLAAITAEDFMNMSRDQGREYCKQYNGIYIYHNGIDATGDSAKSEIEVFDAVVKEFEVIKRIIRQILNFNGTNIIITADHGFIYQNRELEESEFCKIEKLGKIYLSNRRFVIGKNLTEEAGVKKFNGIELGINDDTEFLIAKSIKRLRIQGPGNRYVHGGASLQEIVVPVIQFNKKRKSDTRKVEVDIIKSHSRITTNQMAISFIQTEPVEEKVLSRELKIGFYAKDGKLISDEVKLIFNSTAEDARSREQKHTFSFKSEAGNYANQTVYLKLMEPIEDTSQYREYKEDPYTLHISFTSEFDEM
ncbi:MAG: BREX-1 system phosphatase PglZ type A [Calditrichaceae bacterium]|nr:BREX-1 system phosphatase PglZ type A [Calditrichia bacterium]NUQ43059.1 BREX-1 system phosphatase PglZ type A [Calditrichaceae bacterium]